MEEVANITKKEKLLKYFFVVVLWGNVCYYISGKRVFVKKQCFLWKFLSKNNKF